jgi:hypothetical protein
MKTLRYFIWVIIIELMIPVCLTQEIMSQQTIILQSINKKPSDSQLTTAQEIISRRLRSMNIRSFQAFKKVEKAQLIFHLNEPLNAGSLSEIFCSSGKIKIVESVNSAVVLKSLENVNSPCLKKDFSLLHVGDSVHTRGSVILGFASGIDTASISRCLDSREIKESLPSDLRFFWSKNPGNDGNYDLYCVSVANQTFNETAIKGAHPDFRDPKLPILSIEFTETTWKAWENFTEKNIEKEVIFLLDDKVCFAPRIRGAIAGGHISLTGGGLTKAEVTKLVAIITNGVLPLTLRIVADR